MFCFKKKYSFPVEEIVCGEEAEQDEAKKLFTEIEPLITLENADNITSNIAMSALSGIMQIGVSLRLALLVTEKQIKLQEVTQP